MTVSLSELAPQTPVVAEEPVPDHVPVKDALTNWLDEQGFDATYSADYKVEILKTGIKVNFGQQPKIQEALKAHDLHHLATGYGTTWLGEAEISAWEAGARGPLRHKLIFGAVAILGVLLGPKRIWNAFKAGKKCESLYGNNAAVASLMGMNVGQLRTHLGVPLGGIAQAQNDEKDDSVPLMLAPEAAA